MNTRLAIRMKASTGSSAPVTRARLQPRPFGRQPGPTLSVLTEPTTMRSPLTSHIQQGRPWGYPATKEIGHSPFVDLDSGSPVKGAAPLQHLQTEEGTGRALPDDVRIHMEAAFGTGFSQVRIHQSPHAPLIGALAYTRGHDIYFAPGRYSPHGEAGRRLLGHELTHVLQQRAGRAAAAPGHNPWINTDRTLETEATTMGNRAAQGTSVTVPGAESGERSALTAGNQVIQRAVGFEFETGWIVRRRQSLATHLLKSAAIGGALGATVGGLTSNALTMPLAVGGGAVGTLLGGIDYYRRDNAMWQPLKKYDRIKSGDGFNVEADEAGQGQSEIEFVVQPPIEETNNGLTRLTTVMTNVYNLANDLNQRRNQIRPFTLDQVTGDNADARFEITPQPLGQNIAANPQATIGVRLERVVELMQELGGGGDANELMGLGAGGFPGQAATAASAAHSHTKVQGLLSLIILYLRQGSLAHLGIGPHDPYRPDYALPYVKHMATVMARTDFRAMFGLLPRRIRQSYEQDPDAWVNLVLNAEGHNLDPNGDVIDRRVLNDPDGRDPGTHLIPLTRRQWLRSMVEPNGRDLMTARASPQITHQGTNVFESMGKLGSAMDLVGQQQGHQAPIFELRKISGGMDYTHWRSFARDVYQYVWALNRFEKGGNAGRPRYQRTGGR